MFRSYRDTVRISKLKDEGKHRPAVYDCDMCETGGWLTENDVEIHKKTSHFKEINALRFDNIDRFCSVCMKLQDSKEDLISHIKSQHLLSSPNAQRVEREIYICDICTNIFFNKNLLTAHMQYVHISKKLTERKRIQFKCPMCYREYQLKCMWYHYQMHGLPSVSACDICLTNFQDRNVLSNHLKTHNKHYTCEPCQFSTTRESCYVAHLKTHSRGVQETVSNELVNRVFTKHKIAGQWYYNIHNTVKGLCLPHILDICILCREICSNKEDAKAHIVRFHTEEIVEKKFHVCVCGEEFPHKVVLKQHLMKTKCGGPSNIFLKETSLADEIPTKIPGTSHMAEFHFDE